MAGTLLERSIRKICSAQEFAHRHPHLYRWRVRLLLWFGQVVRWGFAAGAIFTMAAVGAYLYSAVLSKDLEPWALVLFFPPAVFMVWVAGFVLFAFSKDSGEPAGIMLLPRDAPAFFETIREIQRTLRVKKITRVLLTGEMNATMCIQGRLGFHFRSRRYLAVGLPLLNCMGVEHARAVIAHELAHASGRANRFHWRANHRLAAWEKIYKTTRETNLWGAGLAEWFLGQYVPFLRRHLMAGIRALEFEADRLSAVCAGQRASCETLLRIDIAANLLEQDFWPSIYARMIAQPEAEEEVYKKQREFLRGKMDSSECLGWRNWVLARKPNFREAHPSLSERLEALGLEPGETRRMDICGNAGEQTAAQVLLGDQFDRLEKVLGLSWKWQIAGVWLSEYRETGTQRSTLENLRRKDLENGESGRDTLWSLATLTEDLEGRRASFDAYRRLLEADREDPAANFDFGRVLAEEGDARGIPYIEYAIEANPLRAVEGCQIVCRCLYRQNRFEDARPYEEWAARARLEMADAFDERSHLMPDNTFSAPDLPLNELESLRDQLQAVRKIRGAWIARKEVRTFPDVPFLALAIKPYKLSDWNDSMQEALCESLVFRHSYTLVLPRVGNRRVFRRIRKASGSELFYHG